MRVEPAGDVPCDLALFGEQPGFEDQALGEPFVGKVGQQLWADMRRFTGLEPDDFYRSNIIKDGLPKGRAPKPAELAQALLEFIDEIAAVRPRVMVTAGSTATRAVLGAVNLANAHGIPHEADVAGVQFICLPTYSAGAGLHNKGFLAVFAYDLSRLDALLRGKLRPWAPSPSPVRTSWLTRDAMRACEAIAKGTVIGLDTEGWVNLPWGLSFCPDALNGYVVRADSTEQLDWFRGWLAKKQLVPVLHNGLHDIPVLRTMAIELGPYHDTQVLGYHDILRTGSGVLEAESQNLGTLAYREVNLRLGELADCAGVNLASREIPYTDEVMHYAGEDCVATRRLHDVYAARGLTTYEPYVIDMGQVPLVESMIANGIPFDVDATMDFYTDVLEKIETCTADLRAMAARFGNRDFNPGSHPQVRELVTRRIGLRVRKRTKGGQASTNEKALAEHKDHPFVKRLQDHRELTKLRGTYIKPLLEELQ